MGNKKWTKKWKRWIAPTAKPGVFKLEEGGHLVRARVVNPSTGKLSEIKKVMPEADEATAKDWLETERARIRAGLVLVQQPSERFGDFVVSVMESKIKKREIRSPAGRSRWYFTLRHLVEGTTSEDGEIHVPGFGEFFVDQIRPAHVDEWKERVCGLIERGDYAPTTANGWLSILRVVAQAARRRFELPGLFTEGVTKFDESDHVTYSEEEPNSLSPEMVPVFLAALRDLYPQHFAMGFLGLSTGLRPSSLRPLRRRGPESDIRWEEHRLLVRRSQTRGDEVLNRTKQGTRYSIHLPAEAVDVLRWHVETQLVTREQQASDLLFPSVTGGFRAPTVLNKPFEEVSEAIGLGHRCTQRGMRRTFNDLCRAAQVEDLVTRSISGHHTERMQQHYSTVRGVEQQASIAKVIDLMTVRKHAESAPREAPGVLQVVLHRSQVVLHRSQVVLSTKKPASAAG